LSFVDYNYNKGKQWNFFTSQHGGDVMSDNLSPKVNEAHISEDKKNIPFLIHSLLMRNKTADRFNTVECETRDLLRHLQEAKKELDTARSNFEFAEDEQMIDFCIYRLKAAETRYQYILKQIREKNIVNMNTVHIFDKRK